MTHRHLRYWQWPNWYQEHFYLILFTACFILIFALRFKFSTNLEASAVTLNNLNMLLNNPSCKFFSMFTSALIVTAHIQSLPFSVSMASHLRMTLSLFFPSSLSMNYGTIIASTLNLRKKYKFITNFQEGLKFLSKVKN